MANNITHLISLCITAYNRTDLVVRAFSQVLNHPSIGEIVIVDDCSTNINYQKLKSLLIELKSPKIKLFRNTVNLDCYQNKKRAVELASNDWVILFDSDNVIGMDYVDKLIDQEEWVVDCIYAPDFAKPHFDYRAFSDMNLYKENISAAISLKGFTAMINTANYFFNKNEFLKIHKSDINPNAADTAYFNYCWIEGGCTIKVLGGLQYQHDVHDGSHYKENNHKSNRLFDELMGKFNDMPEKESDLLYHESMLNNSIVTVKPQGRMGNALFQYATAFSYAKKHGLRFSIPRETNDAKWNPIYLEHLLIPHGTPDITIQEKTYFKCDELEFKEEWKYGKVIELEGYFQNPKYFQEYRREILEAFNIDTTIHNEDTISIQVRRGDYLIYTDKHPAFSDEYMCNAMDMVGFNKFLVFSDDIPWCRGYFNDKKFNWAQIDFQEGKSEIEDIKGIACCVGHINSSSTFAWWGSWIGYQDAITITPEIWLLHKHANEWMDEIIPSNWIKI